MTLKCKKQSAFFNKIRSTTFLLLLCVNFLACEPASRSGDSREKKVTSTPSIVNDNPQGWFLETEDKGSDAYNPLCLANGIIGIVPSDELFKTKKVILNNVFDKEFEGGVSRILSGFSFLDLKVFIDDVQLSLDKVSNWKQVLDMKKGLFKTSFDYQDKVAISYTMATLRHLPYLGIVKVEILPKKSFSLRVISHMPYSSKDIHSVQSQYRVLLDGEIELPLFQAVGKSRLDKHEIAAATAFLFKEENSPTLKGVKNIDGSESCQFEKLLESGEKYSFSMSGGIATTEDFTDPENEAERFAIYALKQGEKNLLDGHIKAWDKLWENDIMVEGDLESQKDIRFALYNLFSYSREDSRLSIPPMGLSSQGYNGHIFWDTELWMYPPILLFEQAIAKSLLDYRFDRLEKAKQKARTYGYQGAMFPWESDNTGEEATPTWALTGTYEHHITADVGIGFWNYYCVTRDKEWLRDVGYPVLKEVADFWVSRAVENKDGSYSIKNVVGADEYAQNVDDNAFTNGSAKACLGYATKAARKLGIAPDNRWRKVESKIKFHYNKDGVLLEHATYRGEKIKQADVNLLAYPLGMVTDKKQIERDLQYYEPKIDEKWGPAMAHSVLSVIYSSMGDAQNAFRLFKKGYVPNRRPPFGVLSESAMQNNPYFATGAGGMLQAVLFGFGGLRITDQGIVQREPCLPQPWKSLTIKGIGRNNDIYYIN